KGTSWIQEDTETHGRTSADTKILLDQEEPTELVEDPGSGEKDEKEISTAEVPVSIASAILKVSIAIPERQVYIRRSAEKRKYKGKAIMKDDESVQKKTKKQLEQERLRYEEAIRLQEQEKYDLAQALELQKDLDKRKEDVDSEIKKEVMKRSGFDFQKPPTKRQKVGEVLGSVEEQYAGKEKEVSEEELKKLDFNRDDLEKLWDLVKKKFSSTEPTVDKEKVLWVELKRLFEPDDDDILWKLQRYMHNPLKWKLYDTCGVHHVSTKRGHDIFMLVEKDYPLTRATNEL
ncbi:hypothetical protein Tco_0755896, partial [Tanacetum coccineum]